MNGLRLLAQVYDIFNQGLDLIYPGSAGCPMCKKPNGCACRENILNCYLNARVCIRCGKFLHTGVLCLDCSDRGEGFPERVYALAPYSGVVRDAIHSFKYKGEKRTGYYLAGLMWEGPGRNIEKPDLIIPVPLYRDKERQRGFNQAVVLASHLGKRFGAAVEPQAIARIISTQPQSALSREARYKNIINAFTCLRPEKVRGKNILLIDDIITTGYTMEGCGITLRAAGAARLEALCLAAGSQG